MMLLSYSRLSDTEVHQPNQVCIINSSLIIIPSTQLHNTPRLNITCQHALKMTSLDHVKFLIFILLYALNLSLLNPQPSSKPKNFYIGLKLYMRNMMPYFIILYGPFYHLPSHKMSSGISESFDLSETLMDPLLDTQHVY